MLTLLGRGVARRDGPATDSALGGAGVIIALEGSTLRVTARPVVIDVLMDTVGELPSLFATIGPAAGVDVAVSDVVDTEWGSRVVLGVLLLVTVVAGSSRVRARRAAPVREPHAPDSN